MDTNIDKVERMLRAGKTVDNIKAITGGYGRPILRLADTIHKLRKRGLSIETLPIRCKTTGTSTARYFLA